MLTHSYVHGAVSTPLLGETIGACLDRIAAAWPEREALVSCHQQVRYTWAELHAEAERVARGLMAFGVEAGDRVGIWSPNCAEWQALQYAAAKAGAVLVNVNPAYRVRELEYALRHAGVAVLVAAPRFRATDYVAMLEAVRPQLPGLRRVVYLGGARHGADATWGDLREAGARVGAEALRAREAAIQFDDPVDIQYTSGTTGLPKGATLSHHNILNNGFFIGERLRYTPDDRICLPVPLYHCFGCVIGSLAALTHGSAIVIPSETFDAEAALRAVSTERCTSLYGVPTMFIAALQHPQFEAWDTSSLRTGVMAGAPCPVEVMRQVVTRLHMPEVTICYGMTETSPVSFQSSVDDSLDHRVSTVGSIHPHVECKLVDPQSGRIVPVGTPGELCTRGYPVMLGYWEDAEATARAIDAAGWMHTGDLAVMRDDGFVNIVGRLKDTIIKGGENISPREVEEFLYTHPKVSQVQVVGVPDRKYGETVCAWVTLKEGETCSLEDLQAFCRGRIATFKIPAYVRFTDQFPMTVTGKVQKFRMREIMVDELHLASDETA